MYICVGLESQPAGVTLPTFRATKTGLHVAAARVAPYDERAF